VKKEERFAPPSLNRRGEGKKAGLEKKRGRGGNLCFKPPTFAKKKTIRGCLSKKKEKWRKGFS